MTLVAVVDADSFYASCEQLFDIALRGKAIAVLGSNDGNIIARSKEAKALGVAMGAPVHEVRHLVDAGALILRSGNFATYEQMSARFAWAVQSLIPDAIEEYSCDEQFCPLPDLGPEAVEPFAKKLRSRVRKLTGLPVSVGVGRTKTLAKAALERAKKERGVWVAQMPAEEDELLMWLPCGDIWGIGERKAAWLEEHGITQAIQFRDAPPWWVKQHLTVVSARTQIELRGAVAFPIVTERATYKEIMVARAFGQPIYKQDELAQAAQFYMARAAEKLRGNHLVARRVSVSVMTNPFRKNQQQYANHITLTLPNATSYTPTLVQAALTGLKAIYTPAPYHRLGVRLSDLAPENPEQGNLLTPQYADPKERILADLIDAINQRYGRETLRYAGSGFTRSWASKQAHRSPRYLTSWQDIPRVVVQAF